MRTAVRFPISLALSLRTEEGTYDAMSRDISSNGLLFVSTRLPRIGSTIEFTLNMPKAVMGWEADGLIQCTGRVIRHCRQGDERMAAVIIDEYLFKA